MSDDTAGKRALEIKTPRTKTLPGNEPGEPKPIVPEPFPPTRSRAAWEEFLNDLHRAWGGQWSEADGLSLVGSSLERSSRVIASRGVALESDEIIQLLTDRVVERLADEVPWRPGARELLIAVREAGVPTALVTMSIRRMADYIAEADAL